MKNLQHKIGKKVQAGATMVEYALMVALVAIAVAGTVILMSDQMNEKFNDVTSCIQDQSTCPPVE